MKTKPLALSQHGNKKSINKKWCLVSLFIHKSKKMYVRSCEEIVNSEKVEKKKSWNR